jgi:2'-hydroxyisoflavone reductase
MNTKNYAFISSISVYDFYRQPDAARTEDVHFVELNINPEDASPQAYGARKALCEIEAGKGFPEHNLIVLPGLIVGPYDRTYRFQYWLDRIAEGGEVLAPGNPFAPEPRSPLLHL